MEEVEENVIENYVDSINNFFKVIKNREGDLKHRHEGIYGGIKK